MQTIMLIDNNEIDLFVNNKLIKSVSPESRIVSFKNADEALDFLKSIPMSDEKAFPDIILFDLYNPSADNGFKFLKEYQTLVKEMEPKPQILVLSCSVNPYDRIKSLLYSSVKEYIIKPLSTDKIYNILSN